MNYLGSRNPLPTGTSAPGGEAAGADKTLCVLTRARERFYETALAGVPRERLVVQPRNAGTAPAILYGLPRLSKSDPFSAAAVFPSDHYVSDDAAFMSHVEALADGRKHSYKPAAAGARSGAEGSLPGASVRQSSETRTANLLAIEGRV
jgi:hypothetical protein